MWKIIIEQKRVRSDSRQGKMENKEGKDVEMASTIDIPCMNKGEKEGENDYRKFLGRKDALSE